MIYLSKSAGIKFNPTSGILDFYIEDRWVYDIDLNSFRDSVTVLDWIRQLSEKSWVTTQTLYNVCNIALHYLGSNK